MSKTSYSASSENTSPWPTSFYCSRCEKMSVKQSSSKLNKSLDYSIWKSCPLIRNLKSIFKIKLRLKRPINFKEKELKRKWA